VFCGVELEHFHQDDMKNKMAKAQCLFQSPLPVGKLVGDNLF